MEARTKGTEEFRCAVHEVDARHVLLQMVTRSVLCSG